MPSDQNSRENPANCRCQETDDGIASHTNSLNPPSTTRCDTGENTWIRFGSSSRNKLRSHGHLAVYYGTLSPLHRGNGLLQHPVQIRRVVDPGRKQITTRSRLGDARIIRRWAELDIDVCIGSLGPESVGVDQEQRPAGGVPSCLLC